MAEYTIGADKCLTNVNTAINANVNPKVQALQAAVNLVDSKIDGVISGMLINKLTNVDGSSAVVDVIDSCKDGITIYTLKICTDNNYPIALNLSGLRTCGSDGQYPEVHELRRCSSEDLKTVRLRMAEHKIKS